MAYTAPIESPYDETTPEYAPETIPLSEIIRRAIQAALINVRVQVPAKIVKVKGNQKVDVQILLQARYIDSEKAFDIPVIQNVMVSMPMGDGWSIKLPIAVGDTGYLVFCDRSLQVWSASQGQIVDPQDTRAHDISDPIFVPGLVPFSKQTQDETTDMVLTNGDAQMRIQKAGTFVIKNQNQELLNNLTTLVQTLSTASTVAGGPFVASVVNALQQIQSNLDTLKGT